MVSATQFKTQDRKESIPPLEPGDRLTRLEFHRRYATMPHLKKAELVEGVVYVPSPVRYTEHGKPHGTITGLLFMYTAATPGVEFADNATVILDADNEVQPDALLRLVNGSARVNADGYLEGAPELLAEIAASSAAYDLHDKMRAYRRNGVQEYLVWQVYEERIDWFYLNEGRYAPLTADENGILRSQIFPGLHLHARALLRGDLAAAMATAQAGLQTAEHTAFVRELSA